MILSYLLLHCPRSHNKCALCHSCWQWPICCWAAQRARGFRATKIVSVIIPFVDAQPKEPSQAQQLSLYYLLLNCPRNQGNWSHWSCWWYYLICCCIAQGVKINVPYVTVADNFLFATELPREPGQSDTNIVSLIIPFVDAQPKEPSQAQQLSLFYLLLNCPRSQGNWSHWSCWLYYLICCCIAQGAKINVPYVTVADNILFAAQLPKEPGYLEPLK